MSPEEQSSEHLREVDAFQGLNADELDDLNRFMVFFTRRRGFIFYSPDEAGEVLFILKTGLVNLYVIASDGRKLVTGVVQPGTIFGEMALVKESLRGHFAEAAEESLLCHMDRSAVEHMVLTHPRIGLNLLALLSRRLRGAHEEIEQVVFKSVTMRLADLLVRLVADQGGILTITHQEIADRLGVYRETITKILDRFQTDGLIRLRRQQIQVIDAGKLRLLS